MLWGQKDTMIDRTVAESPRPTKYRSVGAPRSAETASVRTDEVEIGISFWAIDSGARLYDMPQNADMGVLTALPTS
jgi:hypothetical protein